MTSKRAALTIALAVFLWALVQSRATMPGRPGGAPGPVDRIQVYLIAPDDASCTGKRVGCDDSVVAAVRPVAPTAKALEASVEALLTWPERSGSPALYNALGHSALAVDTIDRDRGVITLRLTGEIRLRDSCDAPRVRAQIVETVRQFPEVRGVIVYVNGRPLNELLGGY
jgi:hypothetical protein